jgi:hypothetical protein
MAMAIPFENKRFRVNPIELAIFAAVTLILAKSGYSLMYSHEGSETSTLASIAQDPIAIENRGPAAVIQKTFTEVSIGCDPSVESPAVSANKIRLIGALCKPSDAPAAKPVVASTDNDSDDQTDVADAKAPTADDVQHETTADVKQISIVNTSAKVAATVFPDFAHQRYITDYISLAQGKNLIYVQYEFKDGKTLGHEYTVTKN